MNASTKQQKEVSMIGRFAFISSLVLGAAVLVGDASADFKIPAVAGSGADPLRIGAPHFSLTASGYVKRGTTMNSAAMDWVIPLPFYGDVPPHGNAWSVQVMVSNGTACSLEWKANELWDFPGEATTQKTQNMTGGGGSLDVTDPNYCPAAPSQAAGCVTAYTTAQVRCNIPANGYVGAVTYTVTGMP